MSANNGAAGNGASLEPRPIAIAGGGCVGLFLALLLSRTSIPNQILVFDPQAPSHGDTKAMAHQPLVFPFFNDADLMPDLARLGSFSSGLCFRTSVANGSKVVAGRPFKEGEKRQLLLPQWKFQNLLMEKLAETGKAEVRLGWAVERFEQLNNQVAVTVVNEEKKEETVLAEYLIGADGAKSHVRKLLGADFVGETLPAQLVATDIKFPFHDHGFFDANFIIDPVDYGLIGRIDNDGLWRVSYGVPDGMSDEEIHKGVNEKLKKMLPGAGKDEQGQPKYEIVKVAPYRVQQRAAETFWPRGGRVGLCGDAAHLTNAYAGLGLASGIADAGALAQVLSHILTGRVSQSDALLASWAEARKAKFLAVVDKPSRMAYARVKTKVENQEDIDALLARDPLVEALSKGMPMMPPSLVTKCDELEGW